MNFIPVILRRSLSLEIYKRFFSIKNYMSTLETPILYAFDMKLRGSHLHKCWWK